jgi:uncharacterized protein YlxP (DUF503 family)
VVQGLRDRVQTRHHAAFAEVGHLEAHEAAVVAIAVVGNDARQIRSRLDTIRADAEATVEAVLSDASVRVLPLNGHADG